MYRNNNVFEYRKNFHFVTEYKFSGEGGIIFLCEN